MIRRLALMTLAWGLSPSVAIAEEPDTRTFDQLLNAGRAALRKKELPLAAELCVAAADRAEEPPSGGPKSTKAIKLCADVAMAKAEYWTAAKLYRDAQLHSLDDLKEHRRLLGARKSALLKATHPNEAKLVGQILEADTQVQAALRSPARSAETLGPALAELEAAAQLSTRDKNPGYTTLVKAVIVLVKARSGKAKEVRAEAEALLTESTLERARLAALEAAFLAAEAEQAIDDAAELAMRLNQAKGPPGPCGPRTRELDRACKKYDQANGEGACAKKELERFDRYSTYDFSKERKKELGDADIERVHANALAALQACVLRNAKAEPDLYRDSDLTLGWVIAGDGRPKEISIQPKRYEGDLADCATLIGCFRYPKVTSKEPKSVSMPYHLD